MTQANTERDPAPSAEQGASAEEEPVGDNIARLAREHPDVVRTADRAVAEAEKASSKMGGYGVLLGCVSVGAGLGLLLAGPFGVVVGVGVSCFAATRDGMCGDIAKASGETAVLAYDRAQEVNEKYHVTEKVSEAAVATADKVAEVDREHHISERVGETVEAVTHTFSPKNGDEDTPAPSAPVAEAAAAE